jgi:hypothetical protein
VPVAVRLKEICCGDDLVIIESASHKLYADGQVILGEPAWHRDCG